MKQGERSTVAAVNISVKECVELLIKGYTTPQIIDILTVKKNKSSSAVRIYIKKATKLIQDSNERDIAVVRHEHLMVLEDKIATFIKNAEQSATEKDAQNWYILVLRYQQQIAALYPNNLAPEATDSEQTINVSYRVVGGKDE